MACCALAVKYCLCHLWWYAAAGLRVAWRVRHLAQIERRCAAEHDRQRTSYNLHRTSRTKWLDDAEVPARLSERAAMVSELPMSNAERWQLAQYGENCEYKLHVDTVPEFNDLAPGGRFSTLLLYLDEPEEGGTTDFPDLGLRIKPETGTALYFRNVREPVSGPLLVGNARESRAHAGAPVLKGASGHRDALGPPRALPGRGVAAHAYLFKGDTGASMARG